MNIVKSASNQFKVFHSSTIYVIDRIMSYRISLVDHIVVHLGNSLSIPIAVPIDT